MLEFCFLKYSNAPEEVSQTKSRVPKIVDIMFCY